MDNIYIYICVYIYNYTHTHTYIYIYIYIYTYILKGVQKGSHNKKCNLRMNGRVLFSLQISE